MDNFNSQNEVLNKALEDLKNASNQLGSTLDSALEEAGVLKMAGVKAKFYNLKDGSVMITFDGQAPKKAAQKIIKKLKQ